MIGIEDKLYKIANEMVGIVEKESNGSCNEYGEEFIEFATYITEMKEEEIIKLWSDWIKAYMTFSKYNFRGRVLDNIYEPLKIFWRVKPEIIVKQYERKIVLLYARLCISNH